MKALIVSTACALATTSLGANAADCPPENPDWANLAAYRKANSQVMSREPSARKVVFMGDSITEFWRTSTTALGDMPGFVNRGISGQTTPQMVLRFRPDVIELMPRTVIILAGTNDLAGNTGATTPAAIEGNIASMAELAHAHGIRVHLASILPAAAYPWAPGIQPARDIVAINTWLRRYAREHGHGYIDFHGPMADAGLGLAKKWSDDGVHPNADAYELMNRIVADALARDAAAGIGR
jgi:lysophospholipase L1-like esterase